MKIYDGFNDRIVVSVIMQTTRSKEFL